jgi:arylsulfatase A-like enzyme
MRFTDFLPDLSFTFVLWSISGAIFAFFFWLITYVFPRIIPGASRIIRFEQIMVWCILFVFVVFMVFLKRTFFNFSIADLIGISHAMLLILGAVVIIAIFWLFSRSKNIPYKRILNSLNSSMTPLVWLFVFIFIIAVPLAASEKEPPVNNEMPFGNMHFSRMDDHRSNIILVTMDALSARDMQLYGFERLTTPFISEWAKDAVLFSKAYASSNWTTPASMSMMTGQRPWTHRIWYPAKYHPVSQYPYNFPKIMKDNGYAVYAFVQNEHAHPETLGIQDAFMKKDKVDTFSTNKGLLVDIFLNILQRRHIVSGWIFKHPVLFPLIVIQSDNLKKVSRVEIVYDRFMEYISQDAKEPFFAWIHLLPPHDPYVPPPLYTGAFGDPAKFNTEKKQKNAFDFHQEYEAEKQSDVDILRKRYDEFILYCDREFGRLMSRLSENIDMSKTVMILSSDHGESFSKGFLGHNGKFLYEPLVHIPLVIKMPGKTKGTIIDIPVEHVDIAPTILELAEIPPPQWMEGRSLLPLLHGMSLDTRPIFSMQLQENPAINNHPITKGSIAIWDGDYKLILYLDSDVPKTQLYNLKADPDETQNVFHENPDKAEELKTIIDKNLFLSNKRSINTE